MDGSCPYEVYRGNPYSSSANPDGIIELAYAENRLLWDVIEPKLRLARNVPERVTRYEYAYGSDDLRRGFSRLCSRQTSRPPHLVKHHCPI
jgi:hypothetical protein